MSETEETEISASKKLYCGIGVYEESTRKDMRAPLPYYDRKIGKVMHGTPAYEAGLLTDDLIRIVDQNTHLRGPQGSKLTLEVMRDGTPFKVELYRSEIDPDPTDIIDGSLDDHYEVNNHCIRNFAQTNLLKQSRG